MKEYVWMGVDELNGFLDIDVGLDSNELRSSSGI